MAVKITFITPADATAAASEVTIDCAAGTSLFDAGAKARAGIDTACVGKGTCGLCRVKVRAGAERLSPYTDEELRHLGNLYHLTKVRLACRAKVTDGNADGTIDGKIDGEISVEIVRKRRGK